MKPLDNTAPRTPLAPAPMPAPAPASSGGVNPLHARTAASAPEGDKYSGGGGRITWPDARKIIDAVKDFAARPAGELQREILRNIKG